MFKRGVNQIMLFAVQLTKIAHGNDLEPWILQFRKPNGIEDTDIPGKLCIRRSEKTIGEFIDLPTRDAYELLEQIK